MSGKRVWTAGEKRAILEEYELAPWGSKGAVLRRHGVAHAVLARWATYRDHGLLDSAGSRGWRLRMTPKGENSEIVRLRAEVRRLEAERDQALRDREVAEAAAEVLGKASALLQQMLGARSRPSRRIPPHRLHPRVEGGRVTDPGGAGQCRLSEVVVVSPPAAQLWWQAGSDSAG